MIENVIRINRVEFDRLCQLTEQKGYIAASFNIATHDKHPLHKIHYIFENIHLGETYEIDLDRICNLLWSKIEGGVVIMANISACFSSKTDNWSTPQTFFDELNKEFHFTLDPCANEQNHKCDLFFTKGQNGLTKDWGAHSFLQSFLWERYRKMGRVFIPTISRTKYYCRNVDSCQNRHTMVS